MLHGALLREFIRYATQVTSTGDLEAQNETNYGAVQQYEKTLQKNNCENSKARDELRKYVHRLASCCMARFRASLFVTLLKLHRQVTW